MHIVCVCIFLASTVIACLLCKRMFLMNLPFSPRTLSLCFSDIFILRLRNYSSQLRSMQKIRVFCSTYSLSYCEKIKRYILAVLKCLLIGSDMKEDFCLNCRWFSLYATRALNGRKNFFLKWHKHSHKPSNWSANWRDLIIKSSKRGGIFFWWICKNNFIKEKVLCVFDQTHAYE